MKLFAKLFAKVFTTILISSGAFLFASAMMFFIKASEQSGYPAALKLIGPGLAPLLFAGITGVPGIVRWNNQRRIE